MLVIFMLSNIQIWQHLPLFRCFSLPLAIHHAFSKTPHPVYPMGHIFLLIYVFLLSSYSNFHYLVDNSWIWVCLFWNLSFSSAARPNVASPSFECTIVLCESNYFELLYSDVCYNFKFLIISSCFLSWLLHFSLSPLITAKPFAIQLLQYEKSMLAEFRNTALSLPTQKVRPFLPYPRLHRSKEALFFILEAMGY